jgi:tetraacyldisaccharide 4'-kinase
VTVRAYIEDLVTGRRRSWFFSPVLSVIAVLYGILVSTRSILYHQGFLKSRKVKCKVISVGNITLGGTGKTPAVIGLTALLVQEHKRPVVISRGYGRNDVSSVLTVSDGKTLLVDHKQGGDEPVLIASKLPAVPVIVGAARFAAAQYAVEKFDPDVIVLDDGFQHIALCRDIDIVLLDAEIPFGNGKLFPAGPLRERISALKRADAVILTRAGSITGSDLHRLKERLSRYTSAAVYTSIQRPVDLVNTVTGENLPLSVLQRSKIFAFSGIAQPEGFYLLLASLGVTISASRTFADHQDFTKADLADIFQKADELHVDRIITTEKDAVRLRPFQVENIWALRIEHAILEQETWKRFLLERV